MSECEWLETFGDNLKEFMREVGYTQEELAYEADINQSDLSRYINKKQFPGIKAIINISYALNCNVSDLIDFGEMID